MSSLSYHEICDFLIYSGFWNNNPKNKHRFIIGLEPFDCYNYASQFREIGCQVVKFYQGLFQVANYYNNKQSKHANFFNPIINKASDGYPLLIDFRIPPIIKVDIIIDQNDNLKVVEIDGYNPRGISYAILLNDMYKLNVNSLENEILTYLTTRKINALKWIFPNRENFYLNSYLYLKRKFKIKYQIGIQILNANVDRFNIRENDHFFIAPWGLSKPNEIKIKQELIEIYLKDQGRFFFPLKPWLNNKLFLFFPYLKDHHIFDSKDTYIENTIEEYFKIQNYLPLTFLIGKQIKTPNVDNKDFLLKSGISSGHKEIFFKDSAYYDKMFEIAKTQKKPSYILQEKIIQRKFLVPHYFNNKKIEKKYFYCRFIAHYNATGELLNIDLTGRYSPFVYGSTDSIQLPCTFN